MPGQASPTPLTPIPAEQQVAWNLPSGDVGPWRTRPGEASKWGCVSGLAGNLGCPVLLVTGWLHPQAWWEPTAFLAGAGAPVPNASRARKSPRPGCKGCCGKKGRGYLGRKRWPSLHSPESLAKTDLLAASHWGDGDREGRVHWF